MGKSIIIHPGDKAALEHELATQTPYLDPASLFKSPGTLFGLPVVVSKEIPAGSAIVADFSAITDFDLRCRCCGALPDNSGCLAPSLCVCQIAAGGEFETCSACGKCDHHHEGIPFGKCQSPQIVKDVIRTRTRERARRTAGAK